MRLSVLLMLFLFMGCSSETQKLPIKSYKINAAGETEYYKVIYNAFVNQRGEAFTTKNIEGNVFIANFFFTNCPSICPPMRHELIKLSETFKNKSHFMIVSHTIDPDNDTVEILKNYSDGTGIPSKKWQFIRSSEANTKQLAASYMTNFRPNKAGTDFYHSSYVALVDKDQLIRGFYNVLAKEDVERLTKDIKRLLC